MVETLTKKIDLPALKLAFKTTTPVLFGYLAIGIAFGVLLVAAGYSWMIALFMSLTIYAGAGQYLAVGFFANNVGLLDVATVTLLVNFRHMVYGLSLFDKFSIAGLFKPYMIFALTDETYALLASIQEPEGVNPARYYFYISLLDHSYWVLGSLIGAAAGGLMRISTAGLDFALTALFVVLLIEQWQCYKTKLPFLIGAISAVISILIIGKNNMLLAAIILSILLLFSLRGRVIKDESN